MEPAVKDGTIFEVSYLPIEYGKAKSGDLIIETDNFMWTFKIKGSFEKYNPPNLKIKKKKSRFPKIKWIIKINKLYFKKLIKQ